MSLDAPPSILLALGVVACLAVFCQLFLAVFFDEVRSYRYKSVVDADASTSKRAVTSVLDTSGTTSNRDQFDSFSSIQVTTVPLQNGAGGHLDPVQADLADEAVAQPELNSEAESPRDHTPGPALQQEITTTFDFKKEGNDEAICNSAIEDSPAEPNPIDLLVTEDSPSSSVNSTELVDEKHNEASEEVLIVSLSPASPPMQQKEAQCESDIEIQDVDQTSAIESKVVTPPKRRRKRPQVIDP